MYGIEPDSRYVAIDFNDTKILTISSENTTDTKDEVVNKVKADNKNTMQKRKRSSLYFKRICG